MAKTVWAASAALYVGVVVWAGFVLPAEGVAAQLDLDGTVTSYGTRAGFLGANAGLAVLALVIVPLVTRASTRPPATLLNLPNKDYWLAPERADATFALVSRTLWLIFAGMNLVLAGAMYDLVTLTLHGRETIGNLLWFGYIVGVTVWAVWFVRHFRRPEGA